MHRWRRLAAIAAAVVAVVALAFVVRTLNTAGMFNNLAPAFAGSCQAVTGVPASGDIAVDRPAGLAFISAAGREPTGRDGIYVLRLAHPQMGVVRLKGTPGDFHPGAISLYRGADGSMTLMAIDRSSKGAAVDIFGVTVATGSDGTPSVSLEERGSVRSSLLSSPNGVVAVGANSFYATNGRLAHTSFGGMLQAYLSLPGDTVVYFDGQIPHVVANSLRGASGIAISHHGDELYVAEMLGREIQTYDIQPVSGTLAPKSRYALPAGLENIDVDASGNLWVAGQPKLFAYARYADDRGHPSPSQVFRVATLNGVPSAFTAIYTGLGTRLGAASTAAYVDGRLLIGSALDSKLLDCRLR